MAEDVDEEKDNHEEGPLLGASRRCTDVLCLISLLSCWFCMSILGLIAIGWIESSKLPGGDPRRLVYGLDYLGSLCSVDDASDKTSGKEYRKHDVSRLPKSYWLPSGASVCVEKCPKRTDFDRFLCQYEIQEELDQLLRDGDYEGYWERGAKGVREYRCNYQWSTFEFLNTCVYDQTPDFTEALASSGPLQQQPSVAPSFQHFAVVPTRDPTRAPTPSTSASPTFKTLPSCQQSLEQDYCDRLVNQSRTYYCYSLFCPDCPLPGACDFACGFCETAAPTAAVDQKKDGSSTFRVVEKLAADLQIAYVPILVFGCGVSIFASGVYLMVLQIPYLLSLIIWFFACIIFFALLGCGAVAAHLAAASENESSESSSSSSSDDKTKVLRVVSAVTLAAAALYACFLVAARKRISLAVGIIREAARALSQMPALLLLPLLQCAGNLAFFLVWIVYATYLASSGTIETKSAKYDDGVEVSYKSIDYSRDQHYAAIYLIFAWYWTTEFVEAMGTLVVASAVARWYFDRSKPTMASPTTLLGFVGVICKRHAGTAAFGGLVIAAVKLIRGVLGYLKRRSPAGRFRLLSRIATSCATCCLGCIERCIKFVSKHAYVETAIKGYGFCAAGRAAFGLLYANGFRVFSCSVVSTFVLGLGKIAVALATAFGFYVFLATFDHDDMYSYLPSTVLVFLMALASVSVFSQIFDTTITAILHCFLVDEAEYGDHPYAGAALRKVIDSTQEKSRGRLGLSKPKWFSRQQTIHPRSQLRATFDEFDKDKSGYVSPSELEEMLERCVGSRPEREELDAMINFIDKDHDGYVSFSEFAAIHQASLDGTLPFRSLSEAIVAFEDLVHTVGDDGST